MKTHLSLAGMAIIAAAWPPLASAAITPSDSIKPRVNTVTLSAQGVSCNLSYYTGLAEGSDTAAALRTLASPEFVAGSADFCDGDASMELNFQIDMFGSKVVTKLVDGRPVSTEAGKYVVVTVSPEAQAGAGWHLADDLRHKQDFITAITGLSGRARSESLGPIANRYEFWIRKPSDSKVRLVEKFPGNKNRQVSIEETRSIQVGITGLIEATIGGNLGGTVTPGSGTSPPSGSGTGGVTGSLRGQLTGALQQTNGRKLSYMGTEYAINNKSTAQVAKWTWSLDLQDDEERLCDYLTKRDLNTCLFTLPLLDSGRIINSSKFSGAAYSNFVPAFQAVFKADPDYAERSSFEFGSSMTPATMLASARPSWSPALLFKEGNMVPGLDGIMGVIEKLMPDVLKFVAAVKPGTAQGVTEVLTVDWDQAYFQPEQNIRLQVISSPDANSPETLNTLCLAALVDNAAAPVDEYPVSFEKCAAAKNQVWGYDAEENLFKSRAVKGRQFCLAFPNMDLRVFNSYTVLAKGNPNKLVILPCTGLDNRQKLILRGTGALGVATGDDTRLLGFMSQMEHVLGPDGAALIGTDGNYILQRVRYTAMMPTNYTQIKKIEALPAMQALY